MHSYCNAGSLHCGEDLNQAGRNELLYLYKILEFLINRSCLDTRTMIVSGIEAYCTLHSHPKTTSCNYVNKVCIASYLRKKEVIRGLWRGESG